MTQIVTHIVLIKDVTNLISLRTYVAFQPANFILQCASEALMKVIKITMKTETYCKHCITVEFSAMRSFPITLFFSVGTFKYFPRQRLSRDLNGIWRENITSWILMRMTTASPTIPHKSRARRKRFRRSVVEDHRVSLPRDKENSLKVQIVSAGFARVTV